MKPLCLGGEVLADAEDGVALSVVEGEEFESVAEALAVADDGADLDGIGREGQRNFESDDLAGFEAAGESSTDAVLAHFCGASPARAELSGLKHFDLQSYVDDEAGEAASKGNLASGRIGRNTRAASGVGGSSSGLSFFIFTHASLHYSCESHSPNGTAIVSRGAIR